MKKEIAQKVQQLQLFEQNFQNVNVQRQNFQAQLTEIDSALQELKTTKEAYKVIGGIMVLSNKEELSKSLQQKRLLFDARLKKLEEQEKSMRAQFNSLQSEVLSSMGKEDGK